MSTGDPEINAFYAKHRGGSGNVLIVHAYHPSENDRLAVFGSIEAAEKWTDSLDDDWSCVICPYVVDEPEFGNASIN